MDLESKETVGQTKRSFFSAYGSLITLITIIILAFAVLFLIGKPADTNINSIPKGIPPIDSAARSADAGKRIDMVIKQTKGDWSKVNSEDKRIVNRFTDGHGREMFQSYAEKFKKEEQDKKAGKTKSRVIAIEKRTNN
jgi:hypothetical protein